MTKKCIGCGASFQCDDVNKEGYVTNVTIDKAIVCRRCFRIKNYGDYQIINKDIKDYKKIFDKIKSKNSLILFLCDIFNLDETLNNINDFKGKVILVVTKSDLLPKSVKEKKLVDYIKNNYDLNILGCLFVSAPKNYHLDMLMNMIKRYKTDKNVYLVGNTNAGKSTLLNAIISSYSSKESFITTSSLPATTLDVINVEIDDDLVLVDTPGLIHEGNYLTGLSAKDVKIISAKKEIKPRTYQMKPNQSLIIGEYARIDYLGDGKNSFTLYISNDIKINRIKISTNDYLRDLSKRSFILKENKDIVINGLCFCKIVNAAKVDVYIKENIDVFERNNLI